MTVTPKHAQKLAKFLVYVLGRKPYEFGLVPDEQGFIKIKELIKSLNEEEGWRHIRLANLKEVALTVVPCPIEIEDNRIRAKERAQLPAITDAEQPPKLLYIAVRNRAYPAVTEKGLHAQGGSHLVLASDRQMAERIGARRDNHPVMLTVQVGRSMGKGTRYQAYGEGLFLTKDTIMPDTFTGPALPKEKPEKQGAKQPAPPVQPKTPGSYFPDPAPPKTPRRSRRKEVEWKKDRRRARRHKYREQE